MHEIKRAREDSKPNTVISLAFLNNDYYPRILSGLNKGRYKRIIEEKFGEEAGEIIRNSDIPKMEKRYKISIEDYEAEVIGEFEIFHSGEPRDHSTGYIAKVRLKNGVNVYPILTKQAVRRCGIDPDLLKAWRY